MNKFRLITIVVIALEIGMIVLGNVYAIKVYNGKEQGAYRIDVSRISTRIEQGEACNEIDLTPYDSIISVEEFVPGKSCKNDYMVELINGQLYRFEYEKVNIFNVLISVNLSCACMIVITLVACVYIQVKLINPFARMHSITTELSKGNLTVPIQQEKSKYFNEFLWGLDLLREKLEYDKTRELELLKEKKVMILSLSHDIKTPLAAGDLYVKALLSDLYDTKEERTNALRGIENNLNEIKGYVNEITKASREDFLNIEVHNTEVYYEDVINDIRRYYQDKCEQLHTEFVIDTFSNCLLFGDRNRYVEVFQNIMENALKYGDGKWIRITTSEEEGFRLVSVENSGCLIEQEELPHLFDSFYRGSNKGNAAGSGLGLYICKELMHQMDGDVYLKVRDQVFCATVVMKKL